MTSRKISWEIVLAGIAFLAIGIYLMGRYSPDSSSSKTIKITANAPNPPSAPGLPGALVIDLSNLENLKQLKQLKNLKNLKELKTLGAELKNLEQLKEGTLSAEQKKELEKNLENLETELQGIEKADFNIKLQDRKVYINKDYNVAEAQWQEISSGIYVFSESFPVENLKSLKFDSRFGNINVVGSDAANGEITLRATGDIDDPEAISKKLKLVKSLDTPNAEFTIESANGANISDLLNLEATVTLPTNIEVNASTSGGHITAQNLKNNQRFVTSGGHINLNDISGKTYAETKGGHISSNNINGETELKTGGGHIQVQGNNGSLIAKTGGGHIQISGSHGSVIGKTAGGNISASIKDADGPLTFSTSAGNVSLSIPETLPANLDISGSSIKIDNTFDFDGTKDKDSLTGTINGGGVPIKINCDFGSVTVEATN